MTDEMCNILREITRIQIKRQANRDRAGNTINEEMETIYVYGLSHLRERLLKLSPDGRVTGPDETPTESVSNSRRGGYADSVGTTLCQ
jgi:hypothetical protein